MKNKPLIVIFLTVFIDLVGFGIVIPLSPFLARRYGADAFDVGLLMTIYSAMQFLMAPLWGRLSDRWGRRPIILVSLLGAAIGHTGFAFATELWMLFFARAVAGFFGANIATAMAYIADVTTKENRSKGMGMVGAAFGLGFVLGPFMGGVFGHIGEKLGDAAPFGPSFAAVVAGAICFFNFLLAIKVLPETRKVDSEKAAESKTKRFSKLIHALKRPVISPLMIMIFLSTFAMANMEAPFFLFVEDHLGWNQITASFAFAYVGLLMVFTQGYLIRKIMPKYGERNLLVTGFLFLMIGLTAIGFSFSIWPLFFAITILSLGNGLAHPSLLGSVSLLTSDDDQGGILGVNQSVSSLGRIVGPVSGGWLYREWGSSAPFWVAGAVAFVALGLALFTYKKLPEAGRR